MTFIETESIELKKVLNESFEKELVAFLNTNGGTIYIGVNNDGEIEGIQNVDKTMKDIADTITDKILPNPQAFINYSAKYIDGKMIIEVNVEKGNRLYYIKKYGRSAAGCFVRIGTSSRSMTEEQIEKGYIRNIKQVDALVNTPAIWTPITFNQLRIYYESKGFHLDENTIARNLNLSFDGDKYNKLAELVSDKNHVGLIYARFNGLDKSELAETIDFGNQCIITAIEKVINRLEVDNVGISIITTGRRIDKKLVDINALKEAVYNAITNNDWENGRIPLIYKFSDRFEIMSYGGLPHGQTE